MTRKLLFFAFLAFLTFVDCGYGPEMFAHPQPDTYKKWLFWTIRPTLIKYNLHDRDFTEWTNKLDTFLEEYSANSDSRQTCTHSTVGTEKIPCDVDMRGFGPCSSKNSYGYDKGQPCVFLSLEKRDDWMPEFFNDVKKLPVDMPTQLKSFINSSTGTLDNIWVSCDGETPVDVENIGPISYYPKNYFPGYYFPYKNQKNYLSPLIAIQLEKPTRGVVINIRCKAWVGNIEYCTKNRLGTVNFELLID
ncbi:sodium/potassium-transporting ATPase subunit beta-2-like [Culicoides brevitarsis]|uniref:sodium/potassium-transporting ATPase subunit beta-2-like n=1 Tax=Culicoides brevitarsis TaxID=469753 RepID=UPI00307BF11D